MLYNNKFITSFAEKANLFNEYFLKQCKTLINDSILPPFYLITDKQIVDIEFSVEDLKNIIHALNPNDGHMDLATYQSVCCSSVVIQSLFP